MLSVLWSYVRESEKNKPYIGDKESLDALKAGGLGAELFVVLLTCNNFEAATIAASSSSRVMCLR
jgi:hypothetical protein